MGTSLTALQSGNIRYAITAVIEGYPYVLTDGDKQAAIDAYVGTDFARARTGLQVKLSMTNEIQPWRSMSGHGSCVLTMKDTDPLDCFGVDVAKADTGAETILTTALDRNDTTVAVKSTSGFTSGFIYIGNECIATGADTGTSWTGCTRGMYSPFKTSSGARFSEDHRAGNVDYAINLEPIVSEVRRVWTGAWVAVYLHRVVGGVLDTIDQAQRVFAGVIDQPIDDPENGCTHVACVSLLERAKSAQLLREQYKARIEPKIYLSASNVVNASDKNGASFTASSFTFTAGFYNVEEVVSTLNAYLADQKAAGNLGGVHSFAIESSASGTVVKFKSLFPGVASTQGVQALVVLPRPVLIYLGFADVSTDGQGPGGVANVALGGGPHYDVGDYPPKAIFLGYDSGSLNPKLSLYQESGTPEDQTNYLPPELGAGNLSGSPNCVLQLDDGTLFVGLVSGGQIEVYPQTVGYDYFTQDYDPNQGPYVAEVKQVLAFADYAWLLVAALFYSTSTSGWNDATYDVLGSAGLAIPGSLLPATFVQSLQFSALANVKLSVWIDRPAKFEEVMDATLVLLGLYLVWKDQGLRFVEFQVPVTSHATLELTEDNKAEKPKDKASQMTPTGIETAWVKPVVKLRFDYDRVSKEYKLEVWITDRTTVDDRGADLESGTIDGKNLAAADAQEVIDAMKARLGFFTRPLHRATRSLSMALFEGYSAGEVTTLTDSLARDPVTGLRSVNARAGLAVRHTYSIDSAVDDGMAGEIDVIMPVVNRAALWSPCAEVDDGAANAGYNVGTKTLTVKAHEHSEASEIGDGLRFLNGQKVRVVEVDPANTAAPLTWLDTITGVPTGTTLQLTTGLAGWDTTKKYRVVSDAYSVATAAQRADAYQADDADSFIENLAPPFKYELGPTSPYTTETTASRAEFLADVAFGDGKPLDTGHERALCRIGNQLIDYKTAHQAGALDTTERSNTTFAGYQIVQVGMRYFAPTALGSVARVYSVAPWVRSTTGAALNVRVTFCKTLPVGTTLDGAPLPAPNVQAVFATPASLLGVVATAQDLDLTSILDEAGFCFVIIECAQNAATRGLAKCLEGPRA